MITEEKLKDIETKAKRGDYEKKMSRRSSRKRTKTKFFFEEQAKEARYPIKDQTIEEKITHKRQDSLVDSDSDESIKQTQRNYLKGRSKKFRLMKRLEEDEMKRSNSFLSDNDDEEDGEEDGGNESRLERANDEQLLDGDEINNAIIQNRIAHRSNVQSRNEAVKSSSRSRLREERIMQQQNNNNMNNITININNTGTTINNTGTTINNHLPSTLGDYQTIFNNQRLAMEQQYAQQMAFNAMAPFLPPIGHYQSNAYAPVPTHASLPNDIEGCMQLLTQRGQHAWVEKYRVALEMHQSGTLRGGYNSNDIELSDWLAYQRRVLNSLCNLKRRLIMFLSVGV